MKDQEVCNIILETGRQIPKAYHETLIACHEMGGDIKRLIKNPTFEYADINKYYYELKSDKMLL